MKIFTFQSLIAMLSLAILLTACNQESSTIETVEQPDLNALALQINESPAYKTVMEIRTSIFDDLANFYIEHKEKIEANPSIVDDFLSSATDYEQELQKATKQLKAEFDVLNTLTENDVIELFKAADLIASTETGIEKSCWDFCHDQYLSCDSNCYARYLYFSSFTYQDYLDCNQNCVVFVFYTCLDLC